MKREEKDKIRNTKKLNFLFHIFSKKILETPSLESNPASKTEIHSLICHKHLYLYISSIKSLLRFYNGLSIIAHDDGTLKNTDRKILQKHIRGIKIISKDFADKKVMKILTNFPNSKKYRKNHFITRQLFDFTLLSEKNKIISLDSDTLFFKKPNKLIEWIKDNKDYVIFSSDKEPYKKEYGVNAGFVCYTRDLINLSLIEKTLSKWDNQDWFTSRSFSWFIAQFILRILIEKYNFKKLLLNPYKYQYKWTFDKKDPTFRHYWTHGPNYKKEYQEDLKRIIEEMKNKKES